MCVLLSSVERPAAVVEAAAACIPLLARLGGGGKMGALHRAGWNCLQHGLIYLLQTLLNNIYQYVDCVPVSFLLVLRSNASPKLNTLKGYENVAFFIMYEMLVGRFTNHQYLFHCIPLIKTLYSSTNKHY